MLLTLAGLLVSLAGLKIPNLARSAADEIGRSVGGVALSALGLILSCIAPRINRETLVNVGLKNVARPVLMVALVFALGLRGELLKEVLLLGVLPAATIAPTLALAHQTYAE